MTPEELAKKEEDEKAEKEKEITDAATKRSKIIDCASMVVEDSSKLHGMKNREILEASMKPFVDEKEIKDYSDEKLEGGLMMITKDRAEAQKYLDGIKTNVAVNDSGLAGPITGIDAKNLDGGEK